MLILNNNTVPRKSLIINIIGPYIAVIVSNQIRYYNGSIFWSNIRYLQARVSTKLSTEDL